ncbi:Hpt domain-containing protein [Nitrincola sp. MINF-07-Sa-05]|uniref:Hpt domain-containing protein n=1 Tax=Nitrincola salilacus TaxID=3400273 RepID=UPI0039182FBA
MMDNVHIHWQQAVDLAGGDEELLLHILELFLSESPIHRSNLQLAVDQLILTDIMFHAHTLKGLLSTFGANEASAAARHLEQLAKQGSNRSEIESQHQLFENQLTELIPHLKQMLKY